MSPANALDAARDRYLDRFQSFERALLSEPAWLPRLRAEAAQHFRDRGLPDTKLEEWRYTNVSRIAKVPFELAGGASDPAATREAVEALSFPVFACSLYVFVDGHFAPGLSAPPALSGDVRIESLARLRAEEPERLEPLLGRLVELKEHPFAALATAFLDDGAALFVRPGTEVQQPIHVVFVSTGRQAPTASYPRVLVSVGAGSRVAILQDHVSLGEGAAFTNAVTEVEVGPNARADVVLIERESDETFCVANVQARVERDARFSLHTLGLGGALVRNDAEVLLADEGASATLHGLFVGAGSQVVDNHTLVDHAMPHGSSRELYKGVLGGGSRGVFRGRVIVRPDAQHTDAQQSNPNLLLADGAEIDTKPQLEIHADDVRCSHGSSIGQIDEGALFYLRSRGIGERRARDILTQGFASEILRALPVPGLGEALEDLVLLRLQRAREEGGPA